MIFWIFAICLTLLVMLAVYVPLSRVAKADTAKAALMRSLAAELNDVDADKGARYANAEEANAARAEIGRRLLALEASPDKVAAPRSNSQIFAAFALVPILAVPLYLTLGQPEYTDQSFAGRIDRGGEAGQQEVAKLIERVEQRLKQQPDDGEGWAVLAPVYFRMGRMDDSLNAFTKAVEFHKGTSQQKSRLVADRSEVLVAIADGKVTPEALTGFKEAQGLDKDNQKPMFYTALHLQQTGNVDEARANWQALIARYKADGPPWIGLAEQQLAALSPPVVTPDVGPTSDQVEAAGEMTPDQRNEMIRGMVDGLAAKLKENPQDQFGWMKLIRARMVLNDRQQALLDLEKARSLFAPGTQGRTEIDSVAQSAGL